MLGIINGIMALVLIVAIGQETNRIIQTQLDELGTNLLVIRPFFFYRESDLIPTRIQYELSDITRIKKATLSVDEAAPFYQGNLPVQYRRRSLSMGIVGTNDIYAYVKNLKVKQGRFLSPIDLEGNRFVAVLNETAAERLGIDSHLLDAKLRVNGLVVKVVGIIEDKATEMGSGASIAYLPLPFYHRLLGQRSQNSLEIYLLIKNNFSVANGITEIKSLVKAMHGPMAEETVRSVSDYLQTSQEIQKRALWVLSAMAGIALLLGGIGITNLLMISVQERTREIGIRKAVGAKDGAILFQFMAEGILLSIGGGLLGVLLGIYAIVMVLPALNLPVNIPVAAIWIGVLFSAGLGIIGSVYPASAAARLKPIEALRYE